MEILAKAPEYYIQQCKICGTVFKYSKCDINLSNIPFYAEDGTEWRCHYDSIMCPTCNHPIKAEREWLIETGWIKKLLENIK